MNQKHTAINDDVAHLLEDAVKFRRLYTKSLEDFASVQSKGQSLFEGNSDLKIEPDFDRDEIMFSFANVRVRFQLLVGISDSSTHGRILCTHVYEGLRKDEAHPLGEFFVDERGITSLTDSRGNRLKSKLHSDLIIAHYIAEALRHNLER